jgi:hypothetical protein
MTLNAYKDAVAAYLAKEFHYHPNAAGALVDRYREMVENAHNTLQGVHYPAASIDRRYRRDARKHTP